MLAPTAAARLRIPSLSQKASYRLVGGPISNAGDNDRITHETILTQVNAVTKEPMRIYIVSGHVSCLYLCHYPERPQPNVLLLDSGTATDARRVDFFLRNHKHKEADGESTMVVGEAAVAETANAASDTSKSAGRHPELPGLQLSIGLAVATHAHQDHAGGAHCYAANGVPVGAPKNIERHYQHVSGAAQRYVEWMLLHIFARALGRTRVELPNHDGKIPKISLPRLEDSRPLPCGFDDWTAVACHGHTGHMVGLFHAATGMFYCADFIVPRSRDHFIAPFPMDLPDEYLFTVERLRPLPVKYLLAAHGGVLNTADVKGGWQRILDDVSRYVSERKVVPLLKGLQTISTLGPEAGMYDVNVDRPQGPVVVPEADPVDVEICKPLPLPSKL